MLINFANRMGRNLTTGLGIGALALCLGAMPASAQQDQPQQDQQQQDQQPAGSATAAEPATAEPATGAERAAR